MNTAGNIEGLINLSPDSDSNRNLTCSGFDTELDAQRWFASFIDKTRSFKMYQYKEGSRIHKTYLQNEKEYLEADVILLPTSPRILLGVIAIEIKRSGETIGPGLSQLHDYLQCIFQVENNIGVMPARGFLFPCPMQHKATASWMQHQRLGGVSRNQYNGHVVFHSGEERLLEFDSEGALIHSKESKSGRKSGSR